MRTNRTHRGAVRRGSIYFSVLGVALIVSAIGVAAMRIARLELEKVNSQHDADYARILAQSSVEFALGRINADSNWRSTYTHDVETSVTPVGISETLAFRFLDRADGDLADDGADPVEILGIGRHRDAEYVYSVTYKPGITPGEQVGPVLHASYDSGGGAHATANLSGNTWLGQYFVPSLPAEAVEWSITAVDVLAKRNGTSSAPLKTCVASADGVGMPAAEIECVSISSLGFASTYDWITFPFTSVAALSPGQGVCVCLESTLPTMAVDVQYEGGGVSQSDSHMLEGGGGVWTDSYADKSIYFRVRGFYSTETGATSEFQIAPGSWQRTTAP